MDTMTPPILYVFAGLALLVMAMLAATGLAQMLGDQRQRRAELRERHEREEQQLREAQESFNAQLARLKQRQQDQLQDGPKPRPYYPPIGRLPALPPLMALPPFDVQPELPMLPEPQVPLSPTYPGDLPPDLYPLWEQEFDATVLARLSAWGEW